MRARILARALWAVTVSLVAGALVLGLANRQGIPLYDVQSTIIAPTFATLGALIVVPAPRQRYRLDLPRLRRPCRGGYVLRPVREGGARP